METQAEQPAGSARCPACGSPIDSGAAICAACGAALTPAAFSPPAEAAPEAVPSPAAIPAATVRVATEQVQTMPLAAPAPVGMDQKRCDWCGALNPRSVERCESCRAMFPRPEQDAAMRRAAEVRIQVAEDEIALRQRMRKRFALRWPFVARKENV